MPTDNKRKGTQTPATISKRARVSDTRKTEHAITSVSGGDETRSDVNTLIPEGTKTDAWVTQMRRVVAEKENDIMTRLEIRKAALNTNADELKARLVPIFLEALHPLDPDDDKPRQESGSSSRPIDLDSPAEHVTGIDIPTVAIGHQNYAQAVNQRIEDCYRLVNVYKSLAGITYNRVASPANPITVSDLGTRLDAWRADFFKDKQKALSELAAGKKVAMLYVEGMLADRHTEFKGRRLLSQEEEGKGRQLLARASNNEHIHMEQDEDLDGDEEVEGSKQGDIAFIGWGNVAHKVQKAMKRLGEIVDEKD